MDKKKTNNFFKLAYTHCEAKGWLAERKFKTPDHFKKMTCQAFLGNYCWVVYVAGFRKKVLEQRFSKLKAAYHHFDLEKIVRMDSYDRVLAVFNNKRKLNSFVTGAKAIAEIGYDEFKKRVLDDWHHLSSLKGIGDVTVHHLAMDLGFDTIKPDLHVTRVSRLLGARHPFELADYLSSRFHQKKMVVDAVIFEFCEQQAFKEYGCQSIEEFIKSKC